MLFPAILEGFRHRVLAYFAFALSLYPMAGAWDANIWPNKSEALKRAEQRIENHDIRAIAKQLGGADEGAFIAPWWLSPEIAYWSRRPAVGGSSHEALSGNVASAQFYSATDSETAFDVITKRDTRYVIAYDADRFAQNSASILAHPIGHDAMCYLLERTP